MADALSERQAWLDSEINRVEQDLSELTHRLGARTDAGASTDVIDTGAQDSRTMGSQRIGQLRAYLKDLKQERSDSAAEVVTVMALQTNEIGTDQSEYIDTPETE